MMEKLNEIKYVSNPRRNLVDQCVIDGKNGFKKPYRPCLLSIRSEVRVLSGSPLFSLFKQYSYLARQQRGSLSIHFFDVAQFCGNLRVLCASIRRVFVEFQFFSQHAPRGS